MVFDPSLQQSDSKVVGTWRLDSWELSSPQASMSLREVKSELGKLPLGVFDSATYPLAGSGVVGQPLPVGFGVVKGAKASPVNTGTKLFKVVGHSVVSFQAFYTDDTSITPDSIDLANGEFIWTGWDGSEEVFADFTAVGENPVDCIKLLLTDSVKGAGLSLTDLDTASTGNKGFGAAGARLEYVMATVPATGAEVIEFPIGLYVNENKDILKWIEQVAAAAFAIVYVDLTGEYQIKSWKPQVSVDLEEITDANMRGATRTRIVASDIITKVISKYAQNHGRDDFQTQEFADDRLRQLRGLAQHNTLEQVLSISELFGATYWAQRTVAMRSVPRRILELTVTQEFMLAEPGDYVRVNSIRHSIDEVWEVLEVTINPGSLNVALKLIDVRGFTNQEGFWVSDSLAFPASLGGASITTWDDSWTDAQKKWALENSGFWSGDENYIDVDDDPGATFRKSVWV